MSQTVTRRLINVDLDANKRLDRSLTGIFGIGLARSISVLNDLGIDRSRNLANLNDEEMKLLSSHLRQFVLEADLRNSIRDNILAKVKIGSYPGQRHLNRLSVRGQRTSTNARTNKILGRRF